MTSVLCFGNLQCDIVCRPVTALPAPGELCLLDSIDFVLSGNGGSTVASLARLGIDVELAGYTGADVVGEQFRTLLQQLGVGTEKLLRHPSVGSGTSIIAIAPGGERSMMIVNGSNAEFELGSVPDEWLEGPQIVAVLSVFLLPQFTGEAVAQLFQRARRRGAKTVLNICLDIFEQGLSSLQPALHETDYFILSLDEGRQLTGKQTPREIIEDLQPLTHAVIVLTAGVDGCYLQDEEGWQHLPALSVEAIDATGAGDSFVAGFCAGLLDGRALSACARLGCLTASYAVTGPGAYARLPRLAELVE